MLSLWRYRYRVRIRYQQIATLNHETNIFDISKFLCTNSATKSATHRSSRCYPGGGGVLRYWSVHGEIPYTIQYRHLRSRPTKIASALPRWRARMTPTATWAETVWLVFAQDQSQTRFGIRDLTCLVQMHSCQTCEEMLHYFRIV
jgi:hypothetical protein